MTPATREALKAERRSVYATWDRMFTAIEDSGRYVLTAAEEAADDACRARINGIDQALNRLAIAEDGEQVGRDWPGWSGIWKLAGRMGATVEWLSPAEMAWLGGRAPSPGKRRFGETVKASNGRYWVRIDATQSWREKAETLAHELAHVRWWDASEDDVEAWVTAFLDAAGTLSAAA